MTDFGRVHSGNFGSLSLGDFFGLAEDQESWTCKSSTFCTCYSTGSGLGLGRSYGSSVVVSRLVSFLNFTSHRGRGIGETGERVFPSNCTLHTVRNYQSNRHGV